MGFAGEPSGDGSLIALTPVGPASCAALSDRELTQGIDVERLLKCELPIELTNGNTGRGHKFWASSKIRKDAEKLLRSLKLVRTPFAFPVVVRVTRLMGPRQRHWDSSSVGRGNWKEIEDALVACGWFADDSYKWIRATEFVQKKHVEASVCVEVFKFEESE